ncbi:type II secretion system protein [Marinomonas sp. PE14-40]|uniref:type II secretion system protein n=1 Tax=Marinomonas sp. PE14-40 TaxID=3060621 RepID=UPI003F661A42
MTKTLSAILIALLSLSVTANENVNTEQDKVINELRAMLEAADKYEQDTGRVLPITSDTNVEYGYLAIDYLIEDPGTKGWNGPYLPYNNDWFGFEQYVSHPDYTAAQLLVKEDSEWSKGSTPEGCNANSISCKIAACIWRVPEKVAKGINEKIDGIYNEENIDSKGIVRYNGGRFVWIVCMTGNEYRLP